MPRLFITVLLATLTACTSWVTQRVPLPQGASLDSAARHRLTLSTGARHLVARVRFERDTLRGIALPGGDSMAVAVTDVARLQTRRFDAAKTAALVSGVALLVVVANIVVADSFHDCCGLTPN